jgi:hypothetical protein
LKDSKTSTKTEVNAFRNVNAWNISCEARHHI